MLWPLLKRLYICDIVLGSECTAAAAILVCYSPRASLLIFSYRDSNKLASRRPNNDLLSGPAHTTRSQISLQDFTSSEISLPVHSESTMLLRVHLKHLPRLNTDT